MAQGVSITVEDLQRVVGQLFMECHARAEREEVLGARITFLMAEIERLNAEPTPPTEG